RNWVYAFDAQSDDPDPDHGQVWQPRSLPETATLSDQYSDPRAVPGQTVGSQGITGTPVIDPNTKILYLVAMEDADDRTKTKHWLHAIDLRTGNDSRPRVEIKFSGWPDAPPDAPCYRVPNTRPGYHQNRPGLLLMNGTVFVAFGSMNDDCAEGWVF